MCTRNVTINASLENIMFSIYIKKNLSLFQCNNFTINFRVLWKLTSVYQVNDHSCSSTLPCRTLTCRSSGVLYSCIIASEKIMSFLLLFKFCYNSIGMSVAVAPDLKKKLGWSSVRYFLTTITAVWKIGQELQRIIDGTKAVSVCSLNMYIYWPFKINTCIPLSCRRDVRMISI